MACYELSDFEGKAIEPHLPNKPRGVPRVDDRRVLNSIFWVLRSGAPWTDLPERYGPRTAVDNRFNRWRKAGVWDRLMDAIAEAHDGDVQMIDISIVRSTSKVPRQKGGARSMSGSLPRRAHNEDSCSRRSPRTANQAQTDGGPRSRHCLCERDGRRSTGRSDAPCRQRL
jgi:transposase